MSRKLSKESIEAAYAKGSQNIQKLTMKQKRDALKYYRDNVHHSVFASFLSLNERDVEWIRDNYAVLEADVRAYEEERSKKLKEERLTAIKENEAARSTGALPKVKAPRPSTKKAGKRTPWRCPDKDVESFLRDSSNRSIAWLAKHYPVPVEDIEAEVVRLRNKG